MEDVVKLRENLNLQQYYIKGEVQDATFLDLDNQFHRMLFDIAEKPQVYVLMQSIEIHFDRVRNLTLQDIKTSNVVRDHEQLLDAIADRNAEAARTVMQKHLSRFRVVEKQVREKFPTYFK